MDTRHQVEGLQGLRRVDFTDEEFHPGKPDRGPRRPGRHAQRDKDDNPRYGRHDRQIRASLAADQFRHAGLRRGAEIDAAVCPRSDAGVRDAEQNIMAGPLAGIRILDLTSVVAGPLATKTLADMGADVIKIEAPEGDAPRHTGPARSPGMAALFMGLNRSKRSLVLDLKTDAAKAALWRLIETADVLVHSMRPQKMEKL